jgi:hypothetical protein
MITPHGLTCAGARGTESGVDGGRSPYPWVRARTTGAIRRRYPRVIRVGDGGGLLIYRETSVIASEISSRDAPTDPRTSST